MTRLFSCSLTRRALLQGLTSAGAAAGLYPIVPLTRAQATPALFAVSAAIQVISGFIQHPDTIGPYLRAFDQKLDLIVGQLQQVQKALADIAEGIASLQAAIPEMIDDAKTKDKVKDLVALASQWFDYGVPDAPHFKKLSPERRQSAVEIGTKIETLIYWFSTTAQGATPQAAVATPLALAIHLNVVSLTGFKTPSEALQPHFKWCDKILDDKLERSVAWWLKTYTGQRSELLSRIGGLKLAKESGLDPAKQSSEHPGLEWMCHMEGDPISVGFGAPPSPHADTPVQAFLVWRFLSKSPDGYPILGLDSAQVGPGRYGTFGVDYHRRFNFDDSMIPKRFSGVARPASCQMTPNRISNPPWITPEFKSLLDERDLLLERDGDRPGLIPQINDLNSRIFLTDSILKIAQSARETALRFKRDIG